MPLVGGFGCLELVLYGIRELALQPIGAQCLVGSGPMRGLKSDYYVSTVWVWSVRSKIKHKLLTHRPKYGQEWIRALWFIKMNLAPSKDWRCRGNFFSAFDAYWKLLISGQISTQSGRLEEEQKYFRACRLVRKYFALAVNISLQ